MSKNECISAVDKYMYIFTDSLPFFYSGPSSDLDKI